MTTLEEHICTTVNRWPQRKDDSA